MSLRWLSARWKRRAWMPVRQLVRPLATVRVDDVRLTVDLNALGFEGWEFTRHRVQPIAPPWTYDLMTGGSTDVIVARDQRRLADLIGRWRGVSLKPA